MNVLQAYLFVLAVLSTLYQVTKLLQYHALVNQGVGVKLKSAWYFWMLLTAAAQIAFVFSLTGVK